MLSVIFYLSSIPQRDLPTIDFPFIDKIVHLGIYGALGFVISRALTSRMRHDVSWERYRSRIFLAVLIATLYGITDEFHQSFVPGRSVEALDVLADTVGATLGGLLCIFYRYLVKILIT